MTEINKTPINERATFTSIKDDRFKSSGIYVNIYLPLKKENTSVNAVLANVLSSSCKKYPNMNSLNRKLSMLYGANISGSTRKVGETIAIVLSAQGIDDKYALNDIKSISQERAELLSSMIFEPNIENGMFCLADVEREKRQVLDYINSIYNDKKQYALNRCTEVMFANEKFSINRLGTKEQVEKIIPKDLFNAWQNMINNGIFEIVTIGSSNYDKVKEIFNSYLPEKQLVSENLNTEVIKRVTKVKRVNDTQEISQSKLVMGFRTGMADPNDNTIVMRLTSSIFGGTAHSKLFLNVREKLSLCYYCSSRYDRVKGCMFVESGVETKNIEAAYKEIIKQLNELKNGVLTDEEISAAKMSFINGINSVSDSIGSLEAWYTSQMFDHKINSPEEAIEEVNKITKEDIVKAANTIQLDTIYTLTGTVKEDE